MKTGCDFCGEEVPARPRYGPHPMIPQEYICEECFHDPLMAWDDLPEDDG